MGVGQDLLDTPFPDMVMNLAFAIAKGQMALDRTSLATARMLPAGSWLLWTLTFLCAALLLGLIGRHAAANTAHTESEKQV